MGTIKIIGFDEQGQAQRLKIRIARILDYDPVTSAEKENIRDSLGVDDSLSGAFTTDLTTTQKLGAGTASPSHPLTVAKTGDNVKADFTNTVNANFRIGTSGSAAQIGPSTSSSLELQTGGTTRCTIDSAGRVGIGSAPAINLGNGLSVDGGSGYVNLNLVKGSSGTGHAVDFSDENGALQFRVGTNFSSGGNNLIFARGTGSTIAWKIDSATGNLVANSTGIDFGSTNTNTGVTVDGSVMSEYESGTWTPAYSSTGTAFTTPPTMDVYNARYVRVGDLVTFYAIIRTDSVDLTGAGGYLIITGLPYAATASSGYNFAAVTVGQASFWANAPAGGYVDHGQSYIYLTKRTSSITGNLTEMTPSDLTAGTTANQNQVVIGGSYYTNA